MKALAQTKAPTVNEIMHRDIAIADASDMLESALQRLQESACHTLPVLRNQELVGLLTADNLGEYLMFKNARNGRKAAVLAVNEATVQAISA